MKDRLGETRYDIVREKQHNTSIDRTYRRDNKAKLVSKHYKAEFDRMESLRADGETGRINFVGYF